MTTQFDHVTILIKNSIHHLGRHLEVNAAAVVCVVFGEDLVDEGLGLGVGEDVDIHVQQLLPPHLTVGVVLDKATTIDNKKYDNTCKIVKCHSGTSGY